MRITRYYVAARCGYDFTQSRVSPVHHRIELPFFITPKSGPVRPLRTLLDASRALTDDLPHGVRRRPHWRRAGWLIVRAIETGEERDLRDVAEALLRAIDREGWMERDRPFRLAAE